MSIQMSYFCRCGWKSGILDHAQYHADMNTYDESHTVEIRGTISSRVQRTTKITIEEPAAVKARNAAIMREARKRGLL